MKTILTPFLAVLATFVVLSASGRAAAFELNDLLHVQNRDRGRAPSLVTPLVPTVPGNREGRGQRRARDAVKRGEIRSLEEVTTLVQNRYPGRLLDVRLDDSRGRPIYHLKMLTRDGRVLRVAVDARTAQILGVAGR